MGILIIYWHVQVPEPSHKMEEAGVHILLSEEIGRMMGTWSGDGETEARPPSWTSASPLPPSPRSQLSPSSSALYTPQCPHTLAQPSLPLRDNQAPKMLFAWNKLQYKTWAAVAQKDLFQHSMLGSLLKIRSIGDPGSPSLRETVPKPFCSLCLLSTI